MKKTHADAIAALTDIVHRQQLAVTWRDFRNSPALQQVIADHKIDLDDSRQLEQLILLNQAHRSYTLPASDQHKADDNLIAPLLVMLAVNDFEAYQKPTWDARFDALREQYGFTDRDPEAGEEPPGWTDLEAQHEAAQEAYIVETFRAWHEDDMADQIARAGVRSFLEQHAFTRPH